LVSIATMVRPTTYYLPIVVVLLILVAGRRSGFDYSRLGWAVVASLAPVLLVVGGWQLRNAEAVESSRFTGIDAVNMYLYRGAGVIGEREGRSWLDVREELAADFGPRQIVEAQGPYYERMFSEGVKIIRDDPASFAIVTWRGFLANVFGDSRDTERIFGYLGFTAPSAARFLGYSAMTAVWALAAVGLWSLRRNWPQIWGGITMVVVTFYVLSLSSGPESYSRFRAPVTPLIMVLVAGGLVAAFKKWRWVRNSGGGETANSGEAQRLDQAVDQ